LADTSREPGDLVPHSIWRRKAKQLWRQANLTAHALPPTLTCSASTWRKAITRESLRALVDRLFDNACQHLHSHAEPREISGADERSGQSVASACHSRRTQADSLSSGSQTAAHGPATAESAETGESAERLYSAADADRLGVPSQDMGVPQQMTVSRGKQGVWAYNAPPPKDRFPYGPLEGTLASLAESADMCPETLKGHNGETFWIKRVHGKRYQMWVADNATYADILGRFRNLSSKTMKRDQTR
jgi:hypothetical protein